MAIFLKMCMFINLLDLKIILKESLSLKKSLYGLKQAPRAWYERLSNFLLKNDFTRGKVDTTLPCKTYKNNILLVQNYVNDSIFDSANPSLCQEFSKIMQAESEMRLMGELKFFLGIQIDHIQKQLTSVRISILRNF